MSKIILSFATLAQGGAARVCANLSYPLCDTYDEVILVTWADVPQFYEYDHRAKWYNLTKEAGGASDIKRMRWFRQLVKREKPDLILSFLEPFNIRVLLCTLGLGVKTIVAERNDPHGVNKYWIMEQFEKLVYRLAKEGYNVKLLHYGRFNDESISKELRLLKSENIEICGETDNPQEVLLNADALCMSSLMEGMPMTIIEAFSVGCPIISTPVGGCSNMVQDGENGILSEGTDEDSYYRALCRFMTLSKEERKDMRKKALDSFEKYDIRTTADNYFNLFKEKMDNPCQR